MNTKFGSHQLTSFARILVVFLAIGFTRPSFGWAHLALQAIEAIHNCVSLYEGIHEAHEGSTLAEYSDTTQDQAEALGSAVGVAIVQVQKDLAEMARNQPRLPNGACAQLKANVMGKGPVVLTKLGGVKASIQARLREYSTCIGNVPNTSGCAPLVGALNIALGLNLVGLTTSCAGEVNACITALKAGIATVNSELAEAESVTNEFVELLSTSCKPTGNFTEADWLSDIEFITPPVAPTNPLDFNNQFNINIDPPNVDEPLVD